MKLIWQKSTKMSKKLNKKLDDAFIPTHITTNKMIRDAAYRNIKTIYQKDLKNVHLRIMKIMSVKSIHDSKFFDFNEFECLVKEASVLTSRANSDFTEFDLI